MSLHRRSSPFRRRVAQGAITLCAALSIECAAPTPEPELTAPTDQSTTAVQVTFTSDVEPAAGETAPRLATPLTILDPGTPSTAGRRAPAVTRPERVAIVLLVLVDAEGDVERVSVRRSDRPGSPHERSAIESIEDARFEPATRAGVAIPAWTQVEVSFPAR